MFKLLAFAFLLIPAISHTQTVIGGGSDWKYLDSGMDQGVAWVQSGFSDTSWQTGTAQFGYGDGDEATTVDWGSDPNNRHITTYFRKTFNVTDASAISSLTVRLIRDDGAVVYLNGSEVVRTNMPAGAITYTTKASASASPENAWNSFPISNTLITGTNTIAVEVHQGSASSSDLSFDLELVGQSTGGTPSVTRGPYLQTATPSSIFVRWRTSTPTDSAVRYGPSSITSPANGTTFNAPANFTITTNAADADSTVRKVRFFRNGTHIGTDFTAPYSISISKLRAGTYDFTATVEDDLCAIGLTPSAVRVTVR